MKRIALLCLSLTVIAPLSYGQETVAIRGDVQIWKRVCQTADLCEGSFTSSERLPISASLTQPASDRELSVYEDDFAFLDAKLVFQTFWRLGTDTIKGYITHQMSLSVVDSNHEIPLSRCTIYQAVEAVTFPVGACTGFQNNNDELIQYGVTLWQASTLP